MTAIRDTPEFRRGRVAETAVMNLMRAAGFGVLRSADYAGASGDLVPRLWLEEEGLVLPDLLVFAPDRCFWMEIKDKGSPTFTHTTQRWDHGFGRLLFRQYERVAAVTGHPVYLVFCEDKNGQLFGGWLSELARNARFYDGKRMDPGGMVFLAHGDLSFLGWYDPGTGEAGFQASLDGADPWQAPTGSRAGFPP
jgi:hypothetical protein